MAKNKLTDESETPKRTPLILCTILQTIGWIFLFNVAAILVMTLTGAQPGAIEDKQSVENVISLISYWFALDFLILGVSVIVFGQLARYVIQQISGPGLLLRWGSKVLVASACITVLWAIYIYKIYRPLLPANMISIALLLFISAVAIKASVLVLLAQILKRVLPIIEESKALV
jgi:hypothetical protein